MWGTLNYRENIDIQLKASSKIPTDGLILKGPYNAVTIAIYGGLTSVNVEPEPLPPPPPPQPRKQTGSSVVIYKDQAYQLRSGGFYTEIASYIISSPEHFCELL